MHVSGALGAAAGGQAAKVPTLGPLAAGARRCTRRTSRRTSTRMWSEDSRLLVMRSRVRDRTRPRSEAIGVLVEGTPGSGVFQLRVPRLYR
jgi:hypothetical protein